MDIRVTKAQAPEEVLDRAQVLVPQDEYEPPVSIHVLERTQACDPRTIACLLSLPRCPDARSLHDYAEVALKAEGFKVKREVLVPQRGDGRRGRIDIVAERGAETVALELDRRQPRLKSVRKLMCLGSCSLKAVVVRDPVGTGTRWSK